jgi:hypothetical protein
MLRPGIEIKDIVPPIDLIQSMGRQMKAERQKRAEILTAEGQRQSAILRAEVAKQAQILQAEGRREAAFRDAEARERSAAAEAKATEVVSEAIAKGEVASINYFIADKYLLALTEIAHSPNQKVLMLPIEATSVLGTLGGIAEIVKATFGGTPGGIGGSPPATDRSGLGAKPVSRGICVLTQLSAAAKRLRRSRAFSVASRQFAAGAGSRRLPIHPAEDVMRFDRPSRSPAADEGPWLSGRPSRGADQGRSFRPSWPICTLFRPAFSKSYDLSLGGFASAAGNCFAALSWSCAD